MNYVDVEPSCPSFIEQNRRRDIIEKYKRSISKASLNNSQNYAINSNINDRDSIMNLKYYGDTFVDKIKDKIKCKVPMINTQNNSPSLDEYPGLCISKKSNTGKITFDEKGNMIKSCNNMFSRIFTPKP